jgi:hypothetical protein
VQGLTIVDYDFGFTGTPTSIELMFFSAAGDKKSVTLTWETASEIDILGFNIYRDKNSSGRKMVKINQDLIEPLGSTIMGAVYTYTDLDLAPRTYYYWLEVININGDNDLIGPVDARASAK